MSISGDGQPSSTTTTSAASAIGRTGEPVVTFRFDAAGAKRFAKVTQDLTQQRHSAALEVAARFAPARELGGRQLAGRPARVEGVLEDVVAPAGILDAVPD